MKSCYVGGQLEDNGEFISSFMSSHNVIGLSGTNNVVDGYDVLPNKCNDVQMVEDNPKAIEFFVACSKVFFWMIKTLLCVIMKYMVKPK